MEIQQPWMPATPSPIWQIDLFHKNDAKEAECKLCPGKKYVVTATSNMIYHVQKHPEYLAKYQELVGEAKQKNTLDKNVVVATGHHPWLAAETPAVFAGPEVEFIRDFREPPAKKSFLGTVGPKYARGGPSTSSASQPQSRSKTVDQEYQAYICEATEDWESNPVDWWRFNKDRYPHLAAIARRYLTAPATSIASKQLFSTANLVYDDHRCRLSPQKAEMLVFLNRNLPILRYRY